MASADHLGGCADGTADEAVVNELAAGLDGRTQEGIRRASEKQSLFACQIGQFFPFLKSRGKRLFTVNMLSCQQSGFGRRIMLKGTGEIQNDLDIRVLKQLIHAGISAFDSVFLLCLLHFSRNQVINAEHLCFFKDSGKILEIDAADGAQPQNPDSYFFHATSFLAANGRIFNQYILAVFSKRSVVRPCSLAYCFPSAAQSIPRSIRTSASGDLSKTSSWWPREL